MDPRRARGRLSAIIAVMPPTDALARPLRDLRISVTDRCNFRCTYCMPREHFRVVHRFLERRELLSYEEIGRLAKVFVQLGVTKIRITGGEPLVRRELSMLVRTLAGLSPDIDLAMTTNGVLLPRHAHRLREAGLRRVTVSLDSIRQDTFARISDARVPVSAVLGGIESARAAGLAPVKVNAVIRRGVNDTEILELAQRFRGTGVVLRFIEYMDVGQANAWSSQDVVPASEILARVGEVHPLEPISDEPLGRVAERWRYCDGAGEIGVVAAVTRPFCGGCTRARLSADGRLYTCLFAADGSHLRSALRGGEDDDALRERILAIWRGREDRYSELRCRGGGAGPRVEMSEIGG